MKKFAKYEQYESDDLIVFTDKDTAKKWNKLTVKEKSMVQTYIQSMGQKTKNELAIDVLANAINDISKTLTEFGMEIEKLKRKS